MDEFFRECDKHQLVRCRWRDDATAYRCRNCMYQLIIYRGGKDADEQDGFEV